MSETTSLTERELRNHVAEVIGALPVEILSVRAHEEGITFVTAWGSKGTLTETGVRYELGPDARPTPPETAAPLPEQPAEESDLAPLAELGPDALPALEPIDVEEDDGEDLMSLDGTTDRFEVFKGKDRQWYIRRIAAQGEKVATSEGHRRRIDAFDEAVREAGGDRERVSIVPA